MIYNKAEHGYCITVFGENVKKVNDDLKTIAQKAIYLIVGTELTKDERLHLQCYVYFKAKVRPHVVRKLFHGSHVEKAVCSPKKNHQYCSKESNFIEFGSLNEAISHNLEYNIL